MGEDAVDELAGHLCRVGGLVVERRDDREDDRTGFGGQRHVAQMNAVERGFAHAEDEGTALFEGDVGGAGDERIGKAVGDGGECAHGARQDDHAAGGMAAAGDGGADVEVGVQNGLYGRGAEELFEQVGAAGEAEFFGEDAERVLRGYEVDASDAGVGFEGAEEFAAEDCSGCAGDGNGDLHLIHYGS